MSHTLFIVNKRDLNIPAYRSLGDVYSSPVWITAGRWMLGSGLDLRLGDISMIPAS